FGCIVGWGAFVMPGSTLLRIAGPVGTVVAMLIGAVAMIAIAANFHFMGRRYPDSGGAFTYAKKVLGYDHAVMCSWSLLLVYIAIIWANATAFVLVSRYIFGPVFQVGFLYQVAGYDVYLGEAAVTLVVIVAFGLMSCMKPRVVGMLNTILAFVLLFGTIACCGCVLAQGGVVAGTFEPAFAPGGTPAREILGVVALAPWAFIGFESVTHSADEFGFARHKLMRVFVLAIVSGALVYVLTTLISVVDIPAAYPAWTSYIADLENLGDRAALPAFHAVEVSLGGAGLDVLGLVLVSAIGTSLLGLYRALGRLVCNMADDGMFPKKFASRDANGNPRTSILFIMVVSVAVTFVGRAAIGWIVDVTTVCASIAYGYVSFCCVKVARTEGNVIASTSGIVGVFLSVVFFFFPLVPMLWSVNTLATESYLILVVWSILGLVYSRLISQHDDKDRFGKSTIVWVALIFLVLFASAMWVRQATHETISNVMSEVGVHYMNEFREAGVEHDADAYFADVEYLQGKSDEIGETLLMRSMVQMVLIVFSLAIMFNIYSLMRKRERELDAQRASAEEASRAKTVFLSNMSHDIRTPMNAIIGYTTISQREGLTLEEVRGYQGKVEAASRYLLALINDVLEMSRIESGRMMLDPVETDLAKAMSDAYDMFETQMGEKHIAFSVDSSRVTDACVLCDQNRLDCVLLNLISNAYKFTPEGGSVSVTLEQLDGAAEGSGSYELRVKDTGIGMTEEFAQKVFEAFERERNTTVSGIQGTGLGMAITKRIVDLMGGTIRINTAPGKGTEFVINVTFPLWVKSEEAVEEEKRLEEEFESIDFSTKRILLAEDNEINREIAMLLLEDEGFKMECVVNGKEAVEAVAASEPGYFDAILMDVQMPEMDGYEATRAIRALEDPALAGIPILAVSANAFVEDVQASHDAGMDGHLAKPLDVDEVMKALVEVLVNRSVRPVD
ncbi:MAG: amino acid permease, partial [Eggerthellaceae bacterium]|nr:amino acid permease [Eggerthellaceae bacterium]